MSDLRERFGGYFGNISAAMTAFRNNEEWREAVLVEIENLAAAVCAEEREACAKLVEEYDTMPTHLNPRLAAAIRGRE